MLGWSDFIPDGDVGAHNLSNYYVISSLSPAQ